MAVSKFSVKFINSNEMRINDTKKKKLNFLIEKRFSFIRLHREALKQSATDPLSGKIDVGILTTGLSTSARKKRAELVAKIKETLKKKGKVPTVNWNKLFSEIKDNSQIVSIFLCMYVCVCVYTPKCS